MIVRRLSAIPLRVRRAGFAVYAAALATGTHWPALTLGPDPGFRLDLLVHCAAFAAWTFLLAGCEWFGPIAARRNTARCVAISAAYAALDEATQGLPGVNRTVLWSDFLANLAGVAAAGAWLWAAGRHGDRNPNDPANNSKGALSVRAQRTNPPGSRRHGEPIDQSDPVRGGQADSPLEDRP